MMAANNAGNPLHTSLCRDLEIEFPIVAFSHCRDVVAAVSNAGGFGMLGAARYSPQELEIELNWLDKNAPRYGVDVLLPMSASERPMEELERDIPAGHRAFVRELERRAGVRPQGAGTEERARPGTRDSLITVPETSKRQIEVALDHPIAAVGFGLGSSDDLITRLHGREVKVFGLVGSVRQARRVAADGVDYVVATGSEAGGHTGDVGTMSLVPQVVDAVAPKPVLAAGGIASGRQLVAAIALGAIGVWIGTLWLISPESELDPIVRQKLLDASELDTVKTSSYTGKPSRRLKSAWSNAWAEPDAPAPLPYPQQGLLVRNLARRIHDQRVVDYMDSPAGQSLGLLRESRTCKALVLELVDEAVTTLGRLSID